ncbi:12876_t:CDS:2 [Cetraspora pellucida]|uniref:12876_t:CDS:1 n=1 Tax=Cetraspora pellucida TaxID=1433469 RepID=A0ACA9L7Q3_9GLOM|nr:12876_t:CDS:2 [Cetraspora pellucida]
MEQTYSDTSASNKIGVHKFLEALRLLDNKFGKLYDGWDYERCFGEDALKKLYRD